jgi:hypothetical protein
MTRAFVEILLLVPTAFAAGFVMFVAGVVQGVMNDLDEATFKRFLHELVAHAVKSPYAIVASSVTFVGMIPYWYVWGFSNWWFTAGLVLWVITSIVSKVTALPIYKRVEQLNETDAAALREERRKLHRANMLRAALGFLSVVLMVIGLA